MTKYKRIVIDEKGMFDPSQCPELEFSEYSLLRKKIKQDKEDE